jgi:hypothetical protein
VGRLARLPGQLLTDPALPQLPVSAPSPWLPHLAAEAPPDPGVQFLARRLGFGNATGGVPPLEVLSPIGHETPQGDAACPACALTDRLLARLQGCLTHLASVGPTPSNREAQKRAAPGAVHRTLRRMHRALPWSCEAPGHPGQHAVPSSGAFHIDIAVSRPGESHPQALSEPDVNVSAHPAPIIQPPV